MNETAQQGEPLSGLKLPTGEITGGSRPERTLRKRNARMARAFNLTGKRVLDLGCAEGLHSLYMAESAAEVIGVDHRASVIARAETNKRLLGISNVTFRCGDIRDRDLFGSVRKFDLIVAWGLLHRVTDIFSFLQGLSPITDALSLEWRTPVFPFMSKLSIAYHSPVGEALDPMNLGPLNADGEEEGGPLKDSDKIEGETGFWEPTPGAVRAMCKRVGFQHSRRLGYGEELKSEAFTTARAWGGQIIRAVTGKGTQQMPLSRVHMVFEKKAGSIEFRDLFGKDIEIPEWDHAMRQRLNERS